MHRILVVLLLSCCVSCLTFGNNANNILDLSGQWQFKIDPNNAGEDQKWFLQEFEETVQLPGTMAQSGKGYDIAVDTKWTGNIVDRSFFIKEKYKKYRQPGNLKVPFWLQPEKHYIGAAWYQKEITVPVEWSGRNIFLQLERPHWETTVWLDGEKMGGQNSLSTPHRYFLKQLQPGKHLLSIRVDNSVKIGVGQNSHSISDHTQSNWNGIAGKIQLEAKSEVYIQDLKIYPQLGTKSAKIKLAVLNLFSEDKNCEIEITAKSFNSDKSEKVIGKSLKQIILPGQNELEIIYPMGDDPLLWDEFVPNLYCLSVKIGGENFADVKSADFGMREFITNGTYFQINGRKTFLRGTLECAIFPKTSHPAMDQAEWLRIFNIARNHGLNHMRFHSWCPPEAAFIAADKAGFYLHVECGSWANQGSTLGDGKPVDQFVWDEAERIVNEYGNHASFCMLAYGNEPAGAHQREYLSKFVDYRKKQDNRRLYTGAAAWPVLPENQYNLEPAARLQAWGAGLKSILNSQPPHTTFDFSDIIGKYNVPYISHEIGQWCVYPNFKEMDKYTGVLKPKNFEIFKETLEENHLGHLAEDYLQASGKLQALCYKTDIEAALRTPGMAGFQLLDLHDFPGQGTALVGVLDPFWEEKGYITAKEYSRFCNSTVPLARLKKRTFYDNETIHAELEVAHFGPFDFNNSNLFWRLENETGTIVEHGVFPNNTIKTGALTKIGNISIQLQRQKRAQKYTLFGKLDEYENSWDIWVYPSGLPKNSGDVFITATFDENAKRHLARGDKVLLCPPKEQIKADKGGNIAVGFSSIFWNTAWTRNQAPHTLGILCDPSHPALSQFPTEFHSNWQWWEPLFNCGVFVLDDFEPGIEPIVRLVDDWFENRSLGLIWEAQIGKGKLLVSAVDLQNKLSERPVVAQLGYSILEYMNSKGFNPQHKLLLSDIENLFEN